MASNINPYNIDTTFPIAGQDNDTQGFRTNYSSIQNNFLTAQQEISAIQNNISTLQTTFLPTYTGVITASSLAVTSGVFWANGAPALYGNTQVASFLPTYTGNISAGNLSVTNLSYVNKEVISSTDVIAGNVTVSANVITTAITTPAGTSANLVLDPDGNGDVVFPVQTEVWVSSTAAANSTKTGALMVAGGVGVSGNLYVGGNVVSTGGRIDAGYTYNAPTTNFIYSVGTNVHRFIIDPSGAITNGTVNLPTGVADATVITISSTQTVTNFQVLPSGGSALVPSANVTLTGGTCVAYFFHAVENRWYKVQ
jgi:hypothetical protein